MPRNGIRFNAFEATARSMRIERFARKVAVRRWECTPEGARALLTEIEAALALRQVYGDMGMRIPRGETRSLSVLRRVLEAALAGHEAQP